MGSRPEILTEDDFYSYFKPFSIWLVKKKHKKFESISNKESKKYFRSFVRKWNAEKLKPIYYDIDALLRKYSHLIQTEHKWNFKLSPKDSANLNSCLSEIQDLNKFTLENSHAPPTKEEDPVSVPKKRVIGPTIPADFTANVNPGKSKSENEKVLSQEEVLEQRRQESKFLRKKEKRDQLEMSPKKMGKEAVQEKKRALNRMLNGEKDQEVEAETYEDEKLDSFRQAKRREELRVERKERKLQEKKEVINEKIRRFNEAEDQKVKRLLESLGLDKKYKI